MFGKPIVIGIALTMTSLAAAQPTTPVKPKKDSCSIVRPFTTTSGQVTGAKAASSTYQALESKWRVDTIATAKEISRLLVLDPSLAGAIAGADDSCPKGGCICPKPPRLAQTTQVGPVVSLASEFKTDRNAASAATAIFLADHPWLVNRAVDSLLKFGTTAQKSAVQKALDQAKLLTSSGGRSPIR